MVLFGDASWSDWITHAISALSGAGVTYGYFRRLMSQARKLDQDVRSAALRDSQSVADSASAAWKGLFDDCEKRSLALEASMNAKIDKLNADIAGLRAENISLHRENAAQAADLKVAMSRIVELEKRKDAQG